MNRDQFDANGRIRPRPLTQPGLEFAIDEVTLMTGAVSNVKLLACAFLIALFVWLRARRRLRMLLPWAANIVVCEILWIADHHTGMLLIALLTAIWITADTVSAPAAPPRIDRGLVVVLALVCAVQIAWTAVSIRNEFHAPYDPSPETVKFLRQHPQARVAAFDFVAVGVQPYFAQNRYFNWRHAYWVWNTGQNPNGDHFTTIEQHPDIVVFSEDLLAQGFMRNDWAPLSPLTTDSEQHDLARNPIIVDLQAHHYVETHRFCGLRFMRFSASYETCHLIYEPE